MPLLLGPSQVPAPPGRAFSFDKIEKPHSSEDKQGIFQAESFCPINEDTRNWWKVNARGLLARPEVFPGETSIRWPACHRQFQNQYQ